MVVTEEGKYLFAQKITPENPHKKTPTAANSKLLVNNVSIWRIINTTPSILQKNIIAHLSSVVICAKFSLALLFENFCILEQIISIDKYAWAFLTPNRGYCLYNKLRENLLTDLSKESQGYLLIIKKTESKSKQITEWRKISSNSTNEIK